MIPPHRRKLGKLPPPALPHPIRFEHYVDARHEPPPRVDWAPKGRRFSLYANDRIGDCTCASAGHMIEVWTAAARRRPAAPSVDDVVTAYSAVSGYDPTRHTHDRGAVSREVLAYWRTHGIGGHTIDGFAAVDPREQRHVRHAIQVFGGIYVGLRLPDVAKRQTVWRVPEEGLVREGEPGSWGGHAVDAVGYDEDGITVITFGERQRMTWDFAKAYCDEAYAVVSHDFIRGRTNETPSGLRLDELLRDLRSL